MKNQKKKARRGLMIFVLLLAICMGLSVFSVANESNLFAGDSIAVLDIAGTISVNDGATYDQEYLLDCVEKIKNDNKNKGLVLHIDSPGGAVYQIDELYLAIMEYKEKTGRPVYAAIETMAASGGYYEACAADKIYANRNAITGSIGVIIGEIIDLSGLLDKLGVDVTFITSGSNKSMGNMYQPMTEEQRAIYQSICDEYYGQFVAVVAKGRGMEEARVRQLADGRIYSAKQALENGLIDGLEPFKDTLARIKTDLGDETLGIQHYSYEAPNKFLDYLSSAHSLQQVFDKQNKFHTQTYQYAPMMYYQA